MSAEAVSPEIRRLVDRLRVDASSVLEVGAADVDNRRLTLDFASATHLVSFLGCNHDQSEALSPLILCCNVARNDGAIKVLGRYLRSTSIPEIKLVGDSADDGSLLECLAQESKLHQNTNLTGLELEHMDFSMKSSRGRANRLHIVDLLKHKRDWRRLTIRTCDFDRSTGPSELLCQQHCLEAFCFQDPLVFESSSVLGPNDNDTDFRGNTDFLGHTDDLIVAVMQTVRQCCPNLKELCMHVAGAKFARTSVETILELLAAPHCKLHTLQLSTGQCTEFSSDQEMQEQVSQVLTRQNSSLLEVSLQCSVGDFHEKLLLLPILERNEFLNDIQSSLAVGDNEQDDDDDDSIGNHNGTGETQDFVELDPLPLKPVMSCKLWGRLLTTLGTLDPVIGLSPTFLVLKSPETNLLEHISSLVGDTKGCFKRKRGTTTQ